MEQIIVTPGTARALPWEPSAPVVLLRTQTHTNTHTHVNFHTCAYYSCLLVPAHSLHRTAPYTHFSTASLYATNNSQVGSVSFFLLSSVRFVETELTMWALPTSVMQ